MGNDIITANLSFFFASDASHMAHEQNLLENSVNHVSLHTPCFSHSNMETAVMGHYTIAYVSHHQITFRDT